MNEGAPEFGRFGCVIQPDEARSWWQPLPSRGFVSVALDPTNTPYDGFSAGMQLLPPGCSVREHGHQANHELLFIAEGTGTCMIEEAEHSIGPGSVVLFGRYARHYLCNTGKTDMRIYWVFMPPGLEHWFSAIGMARTPGEPMPEAFDRPDNVADVQAALRFVPPRPR
jgi:mannose-6-phosphate isomerase-like protein (cupin superfamily)